MKSFIPLGILLLNATSVLSAPDNFLVSLPPQAAGIIVNAEAKLPDACKGPFTDCSALDICKGKLKDAGSPFTLTIKSTLSIDSLMGKYPGLKLDGKSTICGMKFEVKEFQFDKMKNCLKKELVVKVVENPADPTADKVFTSAFGEVDASLRVPVPTQLPGNTAYYVVTGDCELALSPKYSVTVEWVATFGADSIQGVIPLLVHLTDPKVEATKECDRSALDKLLGDKTNPLMPRLAAQAVVEMGKKANCWARFSASLSPSSVAPQVMTMKNPNTSPEKVFGFRIVTKVPETMKLVAFQFESDPKCSADTLKDFSTTSYPHWDAGAAVISRPNRTHLELVHPVAMFKDDLYVFLSGCSSPQKASAEVVLSVPVDNDDKILIADRLKPRPEIDVIPKMTPSQSCGTGFKCDSPKSVDECFEDADAVASKECKIDLSWKGQTKAGDVERIREPKSGIGMGFSLVMPRMSLNISNWVASGFVLSSENAKLIKPGSSVICDFFSSVKVVGYTQPFKANKYEVKFQEPVPVVGGKAFCFVKSPEVLEEVKKVSVEWSVAGVYGAVNDARKLIPVRFQAGFLTGDTCPMTRVGESFVRREDLGKFITEKLPGCQGSEVISLRPTRRYRPSIVEGRGEYTTITVDLTIFPPGNPWSLKVLQINDVSDEANCFVKGTFISILTETSPGNFKEGEKLVVLEQDKFTSKNENGEGIVVFTSAIPFPKGSSKFHLALLGANAAACASPRPDVFPTVVIMRDFKIEVTPTSRPPVTTKADGKSTITTKAGEKSTTEDARLSSVKPLQFVLPLACLFFVFS